MRMRTRRRLDKFLVAGGVVAVGVAGFVGAAAGDQERMARMWTVGTLGEDGAFQVDEVIDWDFGLSTDRHGIYRDVPGLAVTDPITVASPNAPAQTEITGRVVQGEPGVRVRIGDPDTTVSGSKRYTIGYALSSGIVDGDSLSWDAVGADWEYDIEEAEIHILAPNELSRVLCAQGAPGTSLDPCDAEQPEPGHLVIRATDISAGDGITVTAALGAPLAAVPAAPAPPTDTPTQEGAGLARPMGVAMLAALGAAVPTSILVRYAGRERVAPGGAADVAYFAPPPAPGAPDAPDGAAGDAGPFGPAAPAVAGPVPGEVRVDADDLADMATTEFAPPPGVRPEHGGIVLVEAVRSEHKTAWLIDAAIDGAIDIQDAGGRQVRLLRTGPGSDEDRPILDQAFGGRTEVELGSYDSTFATGWASLGHQLESWRRSSGMWDPRGGVRRVLALVLGIAAAVVGGLAVVGGGFLMATDEGTIGVAVIIFGAILAGAGLTAALRSWELKVRTAAGSALWLRVESFRRFLAGSEAFHAEEAAKRGLLREYTAWAVAVGEIDRWSRAVAGAVNIPDSAGLNYVYMAPMLAASTASAATAPSSSGGGGGGGSVGGGGGGGGGGSW